MDAEILAERREDADVHKYWLQFQRELQTRVRRDHYETFFRKVSLAGVSDDEIDLLVPGVFARDWLAGHYTQEMREAAQAVDGRARKIRFTVDAFAPELDPPAGDTEDDASAAQGAVQVPSTAAAAPAPVSQPNLSQPTWSARPPAEPNAGAAQNYNTFRRNADNIILNEYYTYENFVVGPSNRIAHAASLAVSESPARAYNPLFLHGSVGLGKTHLLQAVCHTLLRKKNPVNILYLSCETFINHFVQAITKGDLDDFRTKYRNVDILLVDDIHFMSNKERTQEEFFHTFNTLYNAQKQIVLSSDSPPKEIPSLQDRLVSRFQWGLVAAIEPPDLETRMAILKRKARNRGRELPDDVCHFLAENIRSNIRELEGAVSKVLGYASFTERQITLELARESMRDLLSSRPGHATLQGIIELVCVHYGVSTKDLQSKRRPQSLTVPRQVGMYLARRLTRHSLEEIGGYFGGRDHTTVMYAVEKVTRSVATDPGFADLLRSLEARLASGRR